MKKAIISAAGPYMDDILACSEPTYHRYAEEHSYDVIIDHLETDNDNFHHPDAREARWGKIALLESTLATHDFVVWMDADAMFTKFDRDILEDLQPADFQAFVAEQSNQPYRRGFNPNTGVWPMRQDSESLRFLSHVKQIGQIAAINGTDQEAVCLALGWRIENDGLYVARPVDYSPFLARTGWLPYEWNPMGLARNLPSRVLHCAGMKNNVRLPIMQQTLISMQKQGVL